MRGREAGVQASPFGDERDRGVSDQHAEHNGEEERV